LGGASLAAIAVPAIVAAADYQSVEQVQRTLFPLAGKFDPVPVTLTAGERQTLAALAGPQPPHGSLRVFRVTGGQRQLLGHLFIDEVIGRQDLITYAVGIDAGGKLSALEILSYRESHGGEIRIARWRAQFAGRDELAQLRFQTDIKNIAGATLSCQHVTQGVRWLTAFWRTALKPAS
jgi:hypothetical protein